MKTCSKNDCLNLAISRGKYCEEHRSRKKKSIVELREERLLKEEYKDMSPINMSHFRSYVTTDFISKNERKIIEDRELKMEQELEYEKTIIEDQQQQRLKDEEKELFQIIEISKQFSIEEKKNKILPESVDEDCLNLKFKLPNGNDIKRKFNKTATINDIRNYLDIYFIDNKLKIENYNLILQYPRKKFTIKDYEIEINTITPEKSFIMILEILD